MTRRVGPQPVPRLVSPKGTAQRRVFLAAFARIGTLSGAARETGIALASHYQWLSSPEYQADFALAQDAATDMLEAEARRRAIDGDDIPVGWYQGQPGGTVKQRSDAMLGLLLRGRRRAVFGDHVAVTQTPRINLNLDALTLDEQRTLLKLLERAGVEQPSEPQPPADSRG